MKYFFTGDTHFGHFNILKYCNRPFNSIEEMDRVLIENWNSVVGEKDMVFHLGDFCFKTNPVERLKGKIILIKGNHDNQPIMKSIVEAVVLSWEGKEIYLNHYPSGIKEHVINFIGHVHEKWKIRYQWNDKQRLYPIVNVGVDAWNFKPVTLKEIFDYVDMWEY
jgi:calcineurin-like phosphoesterase family protein